MKSEELLEEERIELLEQINNLREALFEIKAELEERQNQLRQVLKALGKEQTNE